MRNVMGAMQTIASAMALTYGPLGIAAATARVYKHKPPRTLEPRYDPGAEHENHCAFAAFLAAAGVRDPTKLQVGIMRGMLCELWCSNPSVAGHEGISAHPYIRQMARTMWGGMADLQLLAQAARVPISIENANTQILWITQH